MIKIKSGTFGYWNGTTVEPKTSKSEPFEIDPKREKELVEMGVAEYVGTQEEGVDADEENEDAPAVKIVDDVEITVELLEGMKLEALKEFAEPYGVKFEVGMKKADYAQLVFDAIEGEDEEEDGEEDGEEPPTFDPASALE